MPLMIFPRRLVGRVILFLFSSPVTRAQWAQTRALSGTKERWRVKKDSLERNSLWGGGAGKEARRGGLPGEPVRLVVDGGGWGPGRGLD